MKYSYLDMAELEFRYAYVASAIQLLKNKNYGTKRPLSSLDTHVLDYISKNSGITLTQLSKYMMRAKSTLSPVVNGLLEEELIEKQQKDADKRSFGLVLSLKGAEVLEKHYEYNQKLYQSISQLIIDKYGEEYLDAYYEIVSMNIQLVENSIKDGRIVTEDSIRERYSL